MILLTNKIKLISGERGLALPLVIIVMVVLFILGTALLQYATTEAVQVAQSEKRMQAYYLARSGAEAMAEHLIKSPSDASQYFGKTGIGSIPSSSGDDAGSFIVTVNNNIDNNTIIIESKGQVGDNGSVIEEVLFLTLISKATGLFEDGIFANSDLNVSGMREVYGDLSSNGEIVIGSTTRGDGDIERPNQNREYPEPEYPIDKKRDNQTQYNPDLEAGQNDVTINDSFWYDSLKNQNQSTITFDTSDGDLYILVSGSGFSGPSGQKDISIKGGFDIVGNNKVYLFLENGTGEIKTSDNASYNPEQMIILLKEYSTISVETGNRELGGFIYAPNATVELESNSEIKGAIIANTVDATSNSVLDSRGLTFDDDFLTGLATMPTSYERWHYSR